MQNKFKELPGTDLRGYLSGDRAKMRNVCVKVRYAHSQTYNGGVIHEDKWYQGYKVGKPLIPKGTVLIPDSTCGSWLMCYPPMHDGLLYLEEHAPKNVGYYNDAGQWIESKEN